MSRVFPFKSLDFTTSGKPALAGSFMMSYPCVIGCFVASSPTNPKARYRWLELRPLDMTFRHHRAEVTPIETPERLDQLLGCLATLGWTEGVFVEPKEIK